MPIVDGHEAVLAFFAISGFYMALILDTFYASPRTFYIGRFLSLYPIYLFALIASVALLMTLGIHPMTGIGELRLLLSDPVSLLVMVWTSTCVLGQELLFCLAPSPEGGVHFVETSRIGIWNHAPLIQAWSLSLEIMFYALAPFLVRLKSLTLTGLIVTSITLKAVIMTSDLADVVLFKRFFLTEFWLFGCGILAYRLYKLMPPKPQLKDSLFFLALIVTIFSAGVAPEQAKPFALPVATIIALPFLFRLLRKSEFDRLVGKASYPFYLLHFSVIAIFEEYQDEPEGIFILATTLVTAFLVHSIFHPGIESWKQKIRAAKQLHLPGEFQTYLGETVKLNDDR